MAVIDRSVAVDRSQMFTNRYKYMKASNEKYDMANAEVQLIASQVWDRVNSDEAENRGRQLAISPHSDFGAPSQGSVADFDPSIYPRMLTERWKSYCSDPKVENLDAVARFGGGLLGPGGPEGGTEGTPRYLPLDPDLRDHINPRAVDEIVIDMCSLLRIDVPNQDRHEAGLRAAPSDPNRVPEGLVRASPEDVEAARRRPKGVPSPWSHRLVGQPDQSPSLASQPIPAATQPTS